MSASFAKQLKDKVEPDLKNVISEFNKVLAKRGVKATVREFTLTPGAAVVHIDSGCHLACWPIEGGQYACGIKCGGGNPP